MPARKAEAPTRHIVFRAFRLPKTDDALLQARAEQLGVSVSELIRMRLERDLRPMRKAA
jgi:hypothetical protein